MSTTPRLFIPAVFSVGQTIVVEGERYHRLKRVLRCRVSQAITVFNGLVSGEYQGSISSITAHNLTVELTAFTPLDTESALNVHLFQGISKGERMDIVMQKATEMGVNAITPVVMERTVVHFSAERWARRIAHWEGIVLAAAEQSKRSKVPTVHSPKELKQCFSKTLPLEGFAFFCAAPAYFEAETLRIGDTLRESCLQQETAPLAEQCLSLVIGPEGGITSAESAFLMECGLKTLSLGPRILRTETAPIVALSLLQHYLGDLA